jgi:hypothetical protein
MMEILQKIYNFKKYKIINKIKMFHVITILNIKINTSFSNIFYRSLQLY